MRDLLLQRLALCCWALVALLQCPCRSPEDASLYDVGSRGSLSAKDEAPLLLVEADDRPTPRRASGDDGSVVVALLMPPSELTLRAARRCCWSRLEDTAAMSGESERRGRKLLSLCLFFFSSSSRSFLPFSLPWPLSFQTFAAVFCVSPFPARSFASELR